MITITVRLTLGRAAVSDNIPDFRTESSHCFVLDVEMIRQQSRKKMNHHGGRSVQSVAVTHQVLLFKLSFRVSAAFALTTRETVGGGGGER